MGRRRFQIQGQGSRFFNRRTVMLRTSQPSISLVEEDPPLHNRFKATRRHRFIQEHGATLRVVVPTGGISIGVRINLLCRPRYAISCVIAHQECRCMNKVGSKLLPELPPTLPLKSNRKMSLSMYPRYHPLNQKSAGPMKVA